MNRTAVLLTATTLVLEAAAVRAAGPTKSGGPFNPSSCSTCSQDAPVAAGNPTGSLLFAWEGLVPTATRGVPARFFRPLGTPRGPDFQAVAAPLGTTAGDPHLAGNAKGFVLVWSQKTGDDSDVFARRYSPTGVAVGSVIAVSADNAALPKQPEDFAPAVAMGADGSFVVAWVRFVPFFDGANPGAAPAIFVRRFTAAGAPRAVPLQLSTGLVKEERPALCVGTGGGTTVAWTSLDKREPFQASMEGISMRRLQAVGTPQAQTFVLSAPKSRAASPAVGCGKDGGAVVAWSTELAPADSEGDILAQRYAKDGKKLGGVFVVNSLRSGPQSSPALSFDPTGAFVVAWLSRDDLDDIVRVRRFSAAGVPTSVDVEAFNDAGEGSGLRAPSLAHTKAGDFTVVWSDTFRKLTAQRFKP